MIKPEVGKKYVTSDGRVARGICVDREGTPLYPCLVLMRADPAGPELVWAYSSEGICEGGVKAATIVEEYVPKKTIYYSLFTTDSMQYQVVSDTTDAAERRRKEYDRFGWTCEVFAYPIEVPDKGVNIK